MREKRRKRRLNKKRFLIFLIIIFIISIVSYYALTMRVTNIKIIGTNLISDNEIIEVSNLKNYPKLFSITSFTIASRIKKIDLVNDVNVTKNLYGRITIKVDEARILFYNKNNDKLVLSNEKEIDNNNTYLGIPTLINYVPKEIYSDLINGLKLVDDDVLRIISEIEYAPSKTINGETIDDYRFMLRMNDSNTVYMNTVNIKKMNKYLEITSTIMATNEEKNGILYLDSSIEDSFSFKSYQSIEREEQMKKEVEESESES